MKPIDRNRTFAAGMPLQTTVAKSFNPAFIQDNVRAKKSKDPASVMRTERYPVPSYDYRIKPAE